MSPSKASSKAPTWDLDSIFPGGSESSEYAEFKENIRSDLKKLLEVSEGLPRRLDDSSRQVWIEYIEKLQDLVQRIHHASAFVGCLVSQNVDDNKAHQLQGETDVLRSELEKLMVSLEAFAKNQPDEQWKKLVTSDRLKEIRFFLDEVRDVARLKMAPEFEYLAAELAVSGYHAWNRLYDKIYGDLRVKFTEDGKTTQLSVGQLANKMSSPDRDLRRQAFEKLEEAWESRASEASMILNSQAGFRLTLYDRRKWGSPVLEPLLNCRIKRETLDAMWEAVKKSAPGIKQYIEAKKKLLGIDKFRWYDQTAPVGASDKIYTFKEAADLIVENLRSFSEEQADFTRMAIDKRWVEAEDRSGKAGGAFCSGFEYVKQTRMLMTFSGTFDSVGTLAHELGHMYHHWIIQDFPQFAMIYPMTLAETASIFNEFLLTDTVLSKATDPSEKLMLLDQKLANAYILFCNLHARFIFDTAFYTERKNGLVPRARLDELMVESQKKAFADTLADDGYHPLFWASKLHFFLTDVPFYNFPYTFGFLFAGGVYNRAREEGKGFAENYKALLADTGKMTSEDVAKKHMGVDLTKEDFWTEAVSRVLSDVDPFVKLAEANK
ncbi:MAG: M3 family oligoendopeptidase [Candidatus Zixiibacteriota bacterium]|nr:MAG: M3 family oligoendopeptidase [candidate division Zixibacteria bacterium]